MTRGLSIAAVFVCLVACRPPTRLGGLIAEVTLEDPTIRCVKVGAFSLDTRVNQTGQVAVADRTVLTVGIQETPDFTGRVRVTVVGYGRDDCTGPEVELPQKEGALEAAPMADRLTFVFPRPPTVDAGVADAGKADAGTRRDAGLDDGGLSCDLSVCGALECVSAMCRPTGCDRTNLAMGTPCDAGACNGAGLCVRPTVPCPLTSPCDAGVCYPNAVCQPPLRARGLNPAQLPYPTKPLTFPSNPDGGTCVMVYDTTQNRAVAVGTLGATCTWPFTDSPEVSPQERGRERLIFSGTGLLIPARTQVRFVGTRAVALLVHGDALIGGLVNLKGESTNFPGAGADTSECSPAVAGVGLIGGGGGGFLDPGASGGQTVTANGGLQNGDDSLEPLRGGCSGGHGSSQTGAGLGGGAVQLSVRGTLSIINGGISAPGGGGQGGVDGGSAAGGGSGGAILLEANAVVINQGFLTANGGGGGEGGTRSASAALNGAPGLDGLVGSDRWADGGSNGNCCGGNGGSGGAGNAPPTSGTPGVSTGGNTPAGGGGGGSRGRIRIETPSTGTCTLTAATISPPTTCR